MPRSRNLRIIGHGLRLTVYVYTGIWVTGSSKEQDQKMAKNYSSVDIVVSVFQRNRVEK